MFGECDFIFTVVELVVSEIAARTVFYILELIVSGAPRTPHGDHQLCVLHQNIVAGDNIAWFTLNSSLQTTRYPTNDDVKAASCSVALVAFYLAHCALFNILIGDWAGAGG